MGFEAHKNLTNHCQGWWIPVLRVRSFVSLHPWVLEMSICRVGRSPSLLEFPALGLGRFFLVFCGAPSLRLEHLHNWECISILRYGDWRKIFLLGAASIWGWQTSIPEGLGDLHPCLTSVLHPGPTTSSTPQHPHCSG